jgi:hypothetical protein
MHACMQVPGSGEASQERLDESIIELVGHACMHAASRYIIYMMHIIYVLHI